MFNRADKYEIRHRALLDVIRFCGGVTACAERLNVSRARVSNWLNKLQIDIPYEYALLMERLTQVSIERLSPFKEKTNKMIRNWQSQVPVFERPIEEIIVEQPIGCGCCNHPHPILVGTDGVLIRCLPQLEAHQKMGKDKIPVTIIDVGSLLLGVRTLEENHLPLLISERVAIGLRLEQLIGNRQGQRTDLNKKIKTNENSSELRPKWDEVEGSRTESQVSKWIGLKSKNTYRRAKQVYLRGIVELIKAMDGKKIRIAGAAEIAKLSGNQQRDQLQKLRLLLRNNIDA